MHLIPVKTSIIYINDELDLELRIIFEYILQNSKYIPVFWKNF